ncbi:MFS transporter [Paenibacillus sp. GCM10012306]|uniref:MFS transporter n=1 Tax=Paenibacillus sp. GCM10012306 TaxID=3317342 RepID=UPI00361429B2
MKNNMIIYILALAVFLIGTIEYIITGIIDMIAVDLGISTSKVGLLVTVFALAGAIITPILIALTINMDRKKLLMSSFGVFIATNGLMFANLSYEIVLSVRMIQGASGGMATVVAMAVATRLVEKERRGRAIGIILMGLSSSLVLGVPIGTFFSERLGWRVLFIAIGLLSVLPLLIIYKKVPAIKEEDKVTLLNTSFIQLGFALGSGLGGLVISNTSVLYLNWFGLAAVSMALLLAIWLFSNKSAPGTP